jgi:hypothetical protein
VPTERTCARPSHLWDSARGLDPGRGCRRELSAADRIGNFLGHHERRRVEVPARQDIISQNYFLRSIFLVKIPEPEVFYEKLEHKIC